MTITTTRMAASRLTYHSVSRARTVSSIAIVLVYAEGISRAAARLYELHWMTIVDLPAQPLDINLDEVRYRVKVVVPDMLRDVAAADDLRLPTRQILEQRVLLRGQLDWPSAARHAPGACVHDEIVERQL